MPGINCSDRTTRIDRSAGQGALETVVSIVALQQKECGRSITLCFATLRRGSVVLVVSRRLTSGLYL